MLEAIDKSAPLRPWRDYAQASIGHINRMWCGCALYQKPSQASTFSHSVACKSSTGISFALLKSDIGFSVNPRIITFGSGISPLLVFAKSMHQQSAGKTPRCLPLCRRHVPFQCRSHHTTPVLWSKVAHLVPLMDGERTNIEPAFQPAARVFSIARASVDDDIFC